MNCLLLQYTTYIRLLLTIQIFKYWHVFISYINIGNFSTQPNCFYFVDHSLHFLEKLRQQMFILKGIIPHECMSHCILFKSSCNLNISPMKFYSIIHPYDHLIKFIIWFCIDYLSWHCASASDAKEELMNSTWDETRVETKAVSLIVTKHLSHDLS